jgi:hypothetical protein
MGVRESRPERAGKGDLAPKLSNEVTERAKVQTIVQVFAAGLSDTPLFLPHA